MALGTALIASAVIGAGASVYGASQSKKAASKANAAQQAAADKQLAAQQGNFNRISDMNSPFVAAGNAGLEALLKEFGIGSPSVGRPSAPAAPTTYDRAGNIVPAAAPSPSPAAAPVGNGAAAAKAVGGPAGTSPLASPGAGAPAPAAGPSASTLLGEDGFWGAANGQPAAAPAPAAAPQAAPAMTGGQPDFAAYGAANPDVAAEWQRIVSTGNAGNDKFQNDPNKYYAWHYQTYGQPEGRDLPTSGGQPAAAPTAAPTTAPTTAPAVTEPDQPGQPGRPTAAAPPEWDRSEAVQMGQYGSAPDMASFFSNFEADPGYQFRQTEALRGVNAASAVRGKLRSGDAAKALQSRSSDLASQEYGNWFNRRMQQYQAARGGFESDRGFAGNMFDRQNQNFNSDRAVDLGQWEYGVNRGDRNFEGDRGYADSRTDNNTNNLFRLTGVGLQGAGNVAGAGTNYANAASNIYGNQADAASQNAYARANANAGMVGDLAGTATNLFTKWGGSSGSPQAAAVPFNQAGYSSWAGGSW